jgi:hypothetical protein
MIVQVDAKNNYHTITVMADMRFVSGVVYVAVCF